MRIGDCPCPQGLEQARERIAALRARFGMGTLQPFAPAAHTRSGAAVARAISAAAARHGLDPAVLEALVQAESGFRRDAVSPAGALGLTQLMPSTARALGVADPFDTWQNVEGGARYLKRWLDRFNGDLSLALAAYNAGPGAVLRYRGIPPYPETQRFVARVLALAGRHR